MLTARFGKAIGNKFYPDGSFRPFSGNTIISPLHSSSVFDEIKRVQESLLMDGRDEFLMPLVQDSFHMTVFEGVCDQVRDKEHWTSLISPNEDIDVVSKELYERFITVKTMEKVEMKFDHLNIDIGSSIGLVPLTEKDNEIIRSYRALLATALGIKFPNHDCYAFHIGLAYGKKSNEEVDRLFSSFKKKMDEYFKKEEVVFTLPNPLYCTFLDMSCFTPYKPC